MLIDDHDTINSFIFRRAINVYAALLPKLEKNNFFNKLGELKEKNHATLLIFYA